MHPEETLALLKGAYIFMLGCQSRIPAVKQPHDGMKLSSLTCSVSGNRGAAQNGDDVVLSVVHKDTLHGITLAARLTGEGGSLTHIHAFTSWLHRERGG